MIMPVNRRTVLFAAGGAGLALVGSGALFAVTRTPGRALAPWVDLDTPVGDVRLDAFRHAILAPNPHNRQPWQIRLIGTDEAVVTCDLGRRLPHTDPHDRQIVIGFGCFLELARMAAAERGVRITIEPFPEGASEAPGRLDRRPIARLRFVRDATVPRDPLFAAIAVRRSSKVPFDTARPLEPKSLAALTAPLTHTSAAPDLVERLRALTWQAWMIEAETPRTFQESVDLMRIGKAEIEASPDGIALGGAFIEALALAGQISRHQLSDPSSGAFKAGIHTYRPIMASAMGYLWVATPGNSRLDQLDAGRAYVRANLAANRAGLSMHPISQALQEFAEMAVPFREVRTALAIDAAETLHMLARLGYAGAVPPAPRWPLANKVIGT
jgi:hypothetical protein